MSKLAKSVVIVGGLVIVILVVGLYFASQKVTKNVETQLNSSLQEIKTQLELSKGKYNIQGLEYQPFTCSGLMDYTCKSKQISVFVIDPTTRDNLAYENVRLNDIIIDLKDIKSKKHLSLNIKTDVSYPNIEKFFGDSASGELVAFLNHNAQALLPNALECAQEYLLKDLPQNLDSNSSLVSLKTQCEFSSALLNTHLDTTNLFNPKVNKSHILGVFYEIAMANNEEAKNSDLSFLNIPHELESLKLRLESKQTFEEFLAKNKDLSEEKKAELRANFHGGLSFLSIGMSLGSKIFGSYLGSNGEKIALSLVNLASNKIKKLELDFALKKDDFKPLESFYTRNALQWLDYLNSGYSIVLLVDDKKQEMSENLKAIETNETYVPQDSTDDTPQDSTPANSPVPNDLMQPPGVIESNLDSKILNLSLWNLK